MLAITSLAFMLVEVPAPPCSMSTTKSWCSSPAMTRSQAETMAWEISGDSRPKSRLARAAAFLTMARDSMNSGKFDKMMPVIGKFSTARAVWMP